METFAPVAGGIAPFFLLVLAGWAAARTRRLDLDAARALSGYVFWIAFPALLIHSLSAAPPPDAALARGLGAYAVACAAVIVISLAVGRAAGWPRPVRAGAAMASGVGNTAFLGYPLALSLFGSAVPPGAAALVAVDCTLTMALGAGLLQGASAKAWGQGAAGRALSILANPLILAAGLGAALCLTRTAPPAMIGEALGLAGATASPVGLIALGVVLGAAKAEPATHDAANDGREGWAVALAVGMKLLAAPALVWIAMGAVHAPAGLTAAAVLLAACPAAVNVFIQTRTLDVFAAGGARAVALGTATSALTLTLAAAALTAWLTAGR